MNGPSRTVRTSWPEMKSIVDTAAAKFQADEKAVGVSVAATIGGRLVFSEGYGNAMENRKSSPVKVTPMERWHRLTIGSLCKPPISGAALWGLLEAREMNPGTTKVYGVGGVLKEFEPIVARAHARFNIIAGMAINLKNDTYTWYRNGTVSIGQSRDLAAKANREPYKVATGKTAQDIVAMAISNGDKVYTWYLDGSYSIGTSRDLAKHRSIPLDEDQNPVEKVRLPAGLAMTNIVGIAIHKKTDAVFAWYDNGTVSSGNLLDFTKAFQNRNYVTPGGSNKRYEIIDMALSADDQVFAWYSDRTTSTGSSTDLSKHRKLAAFKLPAMGRMGNPYHDITVQHILDHKAGFNGSGDMRDAALMSGLQEGDLTYEDIHRHFLLTRQLSSEPGSVRSYSNHGFGLITLLIPRLSTQGLSYFQFVRDRHLKPLGLDGPVRPRGRATDERDAFLYDAVTVNDKRVIKPREHSDTGMSVNLNGLAAGGWSASPESIVKITAWLLKKYSWTEIDKLGWSLERKGRLSHSGGTGGGVAYAVLFDKGYVSTVGPTPLSEVHVAVATNTGGVSLDALRTLANQAALATAKVPNDFEVAWFD